MLFSSLKILLNLQKKDCAMDSEEAEQQLFTANERELLKTLIEQGIPFLVVGMSAAIIQGAPGATQDIDLWIPHLDDPRFLAALAKIGASYVPPLILNPPQIAGGGLSNIDLVINPDGLDSFDEEVKNALIKKCAGLNLPVLALERIIKSKEAAGRPKDKAALPVLYATLAVLKN